MEFAWVMALSNQQSSQKTAKTKQNDPNQTKIRLINHKKKVENALKKERNSSIRFLFNSLPQAAYYLSPPLTQSQATIFDIPNPFVYSFNNLVTVSQIKSLYIYLFTYLLVIILLIKGDDSFFLEISHIFSNKIKYHPHFYPIKIIFTSLIFYSIWPYY